MKCRFCNAKIEKNNTVCPRCGKKEPQPHKDAAFSAMARTAIMFGIIAALSALAVVLLIAMNAGWDLGSSFDWLKPRENDVYWKSSYTVSDGKAYRKRGQVVATMGDAQLSNGQLQIYYWMQVSEFLSQYGDSADYLGLDYTADLAKQLSTDGKTTWQQYFLESALQTWHSNQAFALLAQKDGFVLEPEDQKYLDALETELAEAARKGGYGSIDEMVRSEMGEGCSAEDYIAYLQVYFVGYRYFTHLYGQIEPTAREVEEYYRENLKSFTSAGITQNADTYVDIRYILLMPEGGTVQEDGSVVYTDAQWDQCRAEAEAILEAWETGAMTQESFISYVAKYSQDPTTAYTGGLCANLVKGDMEDTLDAWCFDSTRKTGDYSLVKTSYGYHIVYFVEAEEIWYAEARKALRESLGQEMVDRVMQQYPVNVDYQKIVLAKPKLNWQ